MFACLRKDRLFTRTGSPYLALELRDRSGTIAARAFQRADELAGRFERGELVRVSGRVERFREQPVLEVADIVSVGDTGSGGVDPAQFLPTAYRDLDELDGFLEHLAREVGDRRFARLLEELLGDTALRAEWRRAPCTRAGRTVVGEQAVQEREAALVVQHARVLGDDALADDQVTQEPAFLG